MGAWIEIFISTKKLKYDIVAPLVGAWIEISATFTSLLIVTASLPSWERGLKSPEKDQILVEGLSLPSWERGLK